MPDSGSSKRYQPWPPYQARWIQVFAESFIATRSLLAELHPVKRRVMAARCEQFRVRSRFDDPARIQYDDAIRVFDCREPVRDDERRPVLHEFREALLDMPLRLRVQRRRRLVQYKNRRVLQ